MEAGLLVLCCPLVGTVSTAAFMTWLVFDVAAPRNSDNLNLFEAAPGHCVDARQC